MTYLGENIPVWDEYGRKMGSYKDLYEIDDCVMMDIGWKSIYMCSFEPMHSFYLWGQDSYVNGELWDFGYYNRTWGKVTQSWLDKQNYGV